ncbi:MAG: hypothetical protein AB2L20_14955 [Mangrovibacterium sp.]
MEDQAPYRTKHPVVAGIDPKELRIGNLLVHNGQIIVVKNISEYGINKEEVTEGYHDAGSGAYTILRYENISPIELTEELLLKAGFEKIERESMLEYNVWANRDGEEILFQADDHFCHSFIQTERNEIKSLHRLQNLYFALTGEELKIILP